RQAGRQRPGGDAGPRAARQRRPHPGDGGRDHGPPAAAAGNLRPPRRGLPAASGREHRRAGRGRRQGGGYSHADRPDSVLEPDTGQVKRRYAGRPPMAETAASPTPTKVETALLVLFLPSVDRLARPVDQDHWVNRALEFLGAKFGGATAYPKGRGVWR